MTEKNYKLDKERSSKLKAKPYKTFTRYNLKKK